MSLNNGSDALTKRSSEMALMPPPPSPKRIKRPAKALDEDDYTDALSHIIARDFFPGLIETETKQEYLDALDSKDPHWISAAERKLTEMMTPGREGRRIRGRRGTSLGTPSASAGTGGETPQGWQGDTPGSVYSTSTTATSETRSKKSAADTNMSLSAFQEKYTSEDNENFYRLLDQQNQKRTEKYSWMWANNKIPAARQIAHRNRQALVKSAKDAETKENDGQQLAIVEPEDDRPAMPDTWISRPNNSFMFAPSSIEDNLQTVAQKNQETSNAPPKAVVYDNTRLPAPSPSNPSSANSVPPSPSLSAVRDAIAGAPHHSETSSFTGGSTPRVNGYAFVDDRDPSPPPPARASPAPSSSSPLSLLAGSDSTPNPFKLQDGSRRETLHHRMVDKVARQKRLGGDVAAASLRSPAAQTPRFMSSPMIGRKAAGSSGGAGGLTPAGEQLMGKIGGGGGVTPKSAGSRTSEGLWEGKARTPRTKGGGGSRLREGWTPKR